MSQTESKLLCQHCQCEAFHLVQKNQHIKSLCASCGKYCRFISQASEEVADAIRTLPGEFMPKYGIHKGKYIKDMPKDYIKYCAEKTAGQLQKACAAYLLSRPC
jgi:hypothetical protein